MASKNLVVGAGFSGATVARLLSDRGEEVTVIDRRNHVAGNSYDYRDDNGVMVHKYGSHIFHTNDVEVWDFINRFTKFNGYRHKVRASIDGKEVPIPFNINSLFTVFPEHIAGRLEKKLIDAYGYGTKIPILELKKSDDADLTRLADYVYKKVFQGYTRKQWGYLPEEMDGAVTARVPVYISRDNGYFQDEFQGIPEDGYTSTIERMLDSPRIDVRLETDYKDVDADRYNRIFYTGSIDEFFDYSFGALPYRSVYFEMSTINQRHYQSNAVINYPCDQDFTRIHEYKYYLEDDTERTTIAKEFSEPFEIGRNDRYYPIARDENRAIYQRYLDKAQGMNRDIFFVGRLGEYRYYDMDKAIGSAMVLVKGLC